MTQGMPGSEVEWKAKLTAEQYEVLRCNATEEPFTGVYWDTHDAGTYRCAGCGARLFSSEAKFDSGTGWPSFWEAADPAAVTTHEDRSMSRVRTEIRCGACGGHLGHVFTDGPEPTGLRYCLNSAALQLERDAG